MIFLGFLLDKVNMSSSLFGQIDSSPILLEECLKQLKIGTIQIVIGTHALIQDQVAFKDLGLIIIDEQHRFGVEQRKKIIDKGYNPEILAMTATPIPRTLAFTYHGDIDVSIIDDFSTSITSLVEISITFLLVLSSLVSLYFSVSLYSAIGVLIFIPCEITLSISFEK